ncbi:MAG: phosphate ABC transporter substrate-binding protein PstS [Limnospira sp.]
MVLTKRVLSASIATLALAFTSASSAIAVTLKGAGASFPAPLYQKYFSAFKQDTGITVTYDAIGSGGGIDRFIADSVDFAGSDAPPSQSQIDQMPKGMVRVPTAGGAVAVVYNLPGVSDLKLSRTALSDIFLGKITKWNDPKIAKDNPGVNLPNLPIKPVVREDSSGTTFIFTRHLSAISPTFKNNVNVSTAPNWPGTPIKSPQNEGVANAVKQTQGAIGYVQDTFARQQNLLTAQVENLAGEFVAPSLDEANRALSQVRFYQDFKAANLHDPDGGYPIIGITWLLVKQQYDNPEKAGAIKDMVGWVLGEGQTLNQGLEYTRIPEAIASQVISNVQNQVAVNP